ncbi:hypothetical protein ACFLVW_05215 [Chloroflexota bacterium]
MKLKSVLSQISKTFGYPGRRRKAKLYRQWLKSGDLAPGAIHQDETAEDIIPKIPKIDTRHLRQHIPYIVLGVCIGASGVGLILVILQSC